LSTQEVVELQREIIRLQEELIFWRWWVLAFREAAIADFAASVSGDAGQ